jgi:translation initiation factor IF-2
MPIKNKRKRNCCLNLGTLDPGVPGAPTQDYTKCWWWRINANRSSRPGFVKGNRPAIVAKVEPTEEEVKNQIRETLEKLQGKGGKSKAANTEEIKRYAPSEI